MGPECEDVTHLPPGEDRCAFVLEYCVQHSYFVYYLKMYYCHISPHGAALSTLVLVRPAGCGVAGAGLESTRWRRSQPLRVCPGPSPGTTRRRCVQGPPSASSREYMEAG